MSKDTSAPFFPIQDCMSMQYHGLTKREWYAGMALQGMNASLINNIGPFSWPVEEACETMAKYAYMQADAMIKAGSEE